ncbi:MAG: leucine-rich repeat protein [Bilifractor sp.]
MKKKQILAVVMAVAMASSLAVTSPRTSYAADSGTGDQVAEEQADVVRNDNTSAEDETISETQNNTESEETADSQELQTDTVPEGTDEESNIAAESADQNAVSATQSYFGADEEETGDDALMGAVAGASAGTQSADEEKTYGNYKYKINSDSNSVTITKYTGQEENVTIPAEIDGRPVIAIGDNSFANCKSLSTVQFPNCLESIDMYAFKGCDNLKDVQFPEGLKTIGYCAFTSPLITSITIPSTVKELGWFYSIAEQSSSFANCPNLETVVFAEGTKSIPRYALSLCQSVNNVTIPASVTEIGEEAFCDCESLQKINLPKGLKTIPESAFAYCGSLRTIQLPDSLEMIDDWAFSDCGSLEAVSISSKVKHIGKKAFEACKNLRSIRIPQSVTSIGEGVFDDCNKSILTIYGYKNSYAETYANDNGITFAYEDAYSYVDLKKRKATSYGGTVVSGQENEVFTSLYDNWYNSYCSYTDAVETALKKSLTDGLIKPQRDDIVEEEKEAFMNQSYILSNNLSAPHDVKDAAYEGLAEFFYDKIVSIPDLDFSKVSPSNEKKVIDEIAKQLVGGTSTYKVGNKKVNISWTGFGKKSGYGTLTVKKYGQYYNFMIGTTIESGKTAIPDYVKQLKELEKNAVASVTSAIIKDVLEESLSKLTSEYLDKKLAPKEEYLKNTGVGNLCQTLKKCHDYYKYCQELKEFKNPFNFVTQITNITDAMNKIAFDDKPTNRAVKSAENLLEKASEKLTKEYISYVTGEKSDDTVRGKIDRLITKVNNYRKYLFGCPINISVYTKDGRQIAYAGDDDVSYDENYAYAEKNGDSKIIYLFTDDPVTIQLHATGYGTLDCSVEEFNNCLAVGRSNFYGVQLNEGQELSLEETGKSISTNGTEISPDEYIPSSANATVQINVASEGEGTIQGAGEYVKGDIVVLSAVPNDGYRFSGWFENENLVETSRVYEFGAKQNEELKAVFVKVDNSPVPEEPEPTEQPKPTDTPDIPENTKFTDINAKDWYYNAVQWAVENNITAGTSATTFSPYHPCTRAQVVTFLWRLAGRPEPSSSENPFKDVGKNAWYYKAVLWAFENQVTNGTTSSTFSPDDLCTRAQIVTFLWNYSGKPNLQANGRPFTDVKEGSWYAKAVSWAVAKKIAVGTSANTFSPDETSNRAQSVTFIYRMAGNH